MELADFFRGSWAITVLSSWRLRALPASLATVQPPAAINSATRNEFLVPRELDIPAHSRPPVPPTHAAGQAPEPGNPTLRGRFFTARPLKIPLGQ